VTPDRELTFFFDRKEAFPINMELSIFGRSVTKSRLHIIIGGLALLVFILTIARLAVKGTPSTRANTWGIAVVSASIKLRMTDAAHSNSLVPQVGSFSRLSIADIPC
jgi:hypothetical protein